MILEILWFFLPVGVANMMPIFANKLFGPGRPVKKKFFGANKTWQGLISGTLGGGLFFLVQVVVGWDGIVDYEETSLLLGFAMGFGAILGDMAESFFKRRLGIQPGKPWIPFDQLDFIFGGLIATSFFVRLSWDVVLIVLVVYSLLAPVVNRIAFALGLRKNEL